MNKLKLMKNNLWVISQKNTPRHVKFKSNKQNIIPQISSLDTINFYRIDGNNEINTYGEQPQILYKKKQKKLSHSFEYKMAKKNYDNNILISDGGLKLKKQKYKTKYNYIYTKPANNQYNEEIKTILTNYALIYDKSAKKNNTLNTKGEKVHDDNYNYRTVRGFSNRPTFKKNFYNNKSHEIHKDRIKIKKNLKKYEESKQPEENKDDLKRNLINGGKKNIRLLLKLIKKKNSTKNKTVEKKMEYLKKNGIGLSEVGSYDFEEEKQPEKEDIKKMSRTVNNFHRKLNNYMKNSTGMSSEKKDICKTLENYNYRNKKIQNKKQFKPIVDQFEFIKKINEEQKIIHTQESISKNKSQKDKMFLTLKHKTNKLNDSFRHNNTNSNKKIHPNKEKESLSKKKKELPSSLTDILNDEWPYSHKRSYRSPKELKNFKKEKRVLKREKANIEELEKNTKLFNKFKNLMNLNYKKELKTKEKENNKNIEKIPIMKSIDINKAPRSANTRNNHYHLKKGKELNEYYIGNNSIVNHSNSTLIEINKYYLNVLESQKLLVDSGFSKKNNNEETNDVSDNNEMGFDKDILKLVKKNLKRNGLKNNRNKNIKINNYIKNKDKNNNINKKKNKIVKKIIHPKDVFKLVELTKFIIQRKIFAILYQYYIDSAIHQNYNIAFSYFIAICKSYPFGKILAYTNYKSSEIVIKRLFLPFIRRNFRDFIGQLYFKRKLRYFIFILNKFFKFKVLEKIYNSSQIEGNEEKYFKIVIFKIMKTLFKPHLKEVFQKLKNNIDNNPTKKENMYKQIDEEYIKNKEDKNIKKENKNEFSRNSSENSEKYKKLAKRYLEYSPTYKKARSYLYESFNEDNSFTIRPNSLDNHQWAKMQAKLQLARYRIMANEFENEEIEDGLDEDEYPKQNEKDLSNKKESHRKEKISKINKKRKKEKEIENSDESSISLKEINKIENITDINKPKEKNKINNLENNKKEDNNKNQLIVNNKENDKEKNIINKNKEDEDKKNFVKSKTLSDNDISADRDESNSIEWDYNLEDKNKKTPEKEKKKVEDKNKIIINENNINKDIKKEQNNKKLDLIDNSEEEEEEKENEKNEINQKALKKDKKPLSNEEEDYLGEFENVNLDIKSESESESARKKEKIKIKKEEKEEKEEKKPNEEENNIIKKSEEIKVNEENKNLIENKPLLPEKKVFNKIQNVDKFSNDLTEEILKKILSSEIISQDIKLIPYKAFKYDLFSNLNSSQSNSANASAGNNINKDLNLLSLGQLSLTDDLSSLNDSIMSSYSAFSVFNKTIKDKKKEHSLNLYFRKIAPKLIKLIKEEIIIKYPRIYDNISTPLRNKSVGLMMSLCLQDADMLRDNYKCTEMKESIRSIIDKEGILKKFEPINRQIRSKDKVTSDNFYDNMLNDCLIDTTIELINKERLYGENGDPLEWSSRTHELVFKYNKSEAKLFAKNICKNLMKTMLSRVGLITENYDYLNAEQINDKREKKLIDNIKNELDEDEYQWRNLEMEETQLKVEIAELIMEQLYNENIEILEHIQYSRNRPDLYLNKSIYACEEIPKLSFQQTTTENATKEKEDNDEVNMN